MSAKPNFGVVFKMGSTATPSTTLTNVFEVGPPKTTREAVDVTDHGSPGGVQEFMADGVYDPGEVAISMHYIAGDANDDACLAALAATGDYYFQWTANATSGQESFTGKGVVISYGPDPKPVKGKQTATMTIKRSGPITQAAVA